MESTDGMSLNKANSSTYVSKLVTERAPPWWHPQEESLLHGCYVQRWLPREMLESTDGCKFASSFMREGKQDFHLGERVEMHVRPFSCSRGRAL